MTEIQLPSHLSKPPTGPLEILLPEEWTLSEPPRFAGKVISFLAASLQDTNVIEFDVQGRFASSSDARLQEYFDSLARDGELGRLIQHCRAMMHPSGEHGVIGWFGAIQQEWAYTFLVFEQAAAPNPRWEVRRKVRLIQTETPESQVAPSGLLTRLRQLFAGK